MEIEGEMKRITCPGINSGEKRGIYKRYPPREFFFGFY